MEQKEIFGKNEYDSPQFRLAMACCKALDEEFDKAEWADNRNAYVDRLVADRAKIKRFSRPVFKQRISSSRREPQLDDSSFSDPAFGMIYKLNSGKTKTERAYWRNHKRELEKNVLEDYSDYLELKAKVKAQCGVSE